MHKKRFTLTLLLQGGGVFLGHQATLRLSETPYQLNILKCFMLTLPINLFTNKISKKNQTILRGYPPFNPLKSKASQKWPTMTAYNPYLLFLNQIIL